ncbi:hypothetical protein KP509_06G063100 [Ceratopteris richardii]|uniref:ENTH domain-containing protein n=2 Tax=Ceratopteris richardii TaxID=49495 RepID=A0A8T2UGP6_CERRI|nr:hypothetical protein KP509_06G063100 [Ceratopteris richardii]
MAPLQRKLRRALGTFKDQTSIGIAKVASNGAPDLEVALVKATSHEESPIEERYVQDILHFTSFSRGYVSACVAGIAKRLSKTHNWVVAIKALMLTHRLLRDGDSAFEHELLYYNRHGMRVLNLSNFRDDSYSHAWDYSAFVRTYALFLDEKLEFNLEIGKIQSEDEDRGKTSRRDDYDKEREDEYRHDMPRSDGSGDYARRYDEYRDSWRDNGHVNGYDTRQEKGFGQSWRDGKDHHKKPWSVKELRARDLLIVIPLMQRLVERVLACRPTGAARMNRLVQIALYPVVRESFQLYTDICDGQAIILDGFFEMDHIDCVKAFEIYSKGTKQIDELSAFYEACKDLGVCRTSEYPVVQKISEELLETMEDYLRNHTGASRRKKSPEPRPKSPEPVVEDLNGIKALPAPPVEEKPDTPREPEFIPNEQSQGDLLAFDNEPVSVEEHGDRLALALFSDTVGTGGSNPQLQSSNAMFTGERPLEGWELALVESASEISKPLNNTLAGGFNNLLLDSMYDQQVVNQKVAASVPAGSASSVAIPGRPASSFWHYLGQQEHKWMRIHLLHL